ncbi:MAG: C13 family peptidase [Candidatus Hodarchaeota archaeon]
MDQILSDRILYSGEGQNPQKTLEFYNTRTEFGMAFSLTRVTIQDTIWNIKHGFKYRMEDRLYHMITELECIDHDFEDIGLVYEITSSPQSDDTLYKPARFAIENELEGVVVSAQETWQASQYFEDFYSQVVVISENNEQIMFVFDDMEQAGFTEQFLKFENQQMPDGSLRKVLGAGMHGLTSYSAGTRLEIDPSISGLNTTDKLDLFDRYNVDQQTWSYYITSNHIYVGWDYFGFPPEYFEYRNSGFITWDTNINTAIAGIVNDTVTCQVYVSTENVESGEGLSATVYNVGGNPSDVCMENSTSWENGTKTTEDAVLLNPGTGWRTLDSTKMERLLEFWADERATSTDLMSFRLTEYNCVRGEHDRIKMYDSCWSGGSYAAKLSFEYMLDYECWGILVAGSKHRIDTMEPPSYTDMFACSYNVLQMYNNLTNIYDGYTDSSLFILTHHNEVYGSQIPNDRKMGPTLENFTWAINTVDEFADSGDQVFFYWVSHGSTVSGGRVEYYSKLDPYTRSWITGSTLNTYLDQIECAEMFIFIDACHSGALIDDFNGSSDRAIYTGCKADESQLTNYDKETFFADGIMKAIDPNLNATDADINDDNRTSLSEIFLFANQTVQDWCTYYSHTQHPQRWVGATIDEDDAYIDDGYY